MKLTSPTTTQPSSRCRQNAAAHLVSYAALSLAVLATGCGKMTTARVEIDSRRVAAAVHRDVAAGDLQQMTLTPSAAQLALGDLLTFSVSGLLANGDAAPNSVAYQFSSSAPDVLQPQGGNKFAAKAPGTAVVTASLSGVSATATVIVGTASCTAQAEFTAKVEPILAAKCISCHGAAGMTAAHSALALTAEDRDPQAALANWIVSKTKLDISDPDHSLILAKVSGIAPHAGGALLKASDAEYSTVATWIRDEAKCQNTNKPIAIAVTPAAASLAPGGSLQLAVTGKYQDNSTAGLSSGIIWTLVDASGAPISADTASISSAGLLSVGNAAATKAFSALAKLDTLSGTAAISIAAAAATTLPSTPEGGSACAAAATFQQAVEPVLQASCLTCHGAAGLANAKAVLTLAGAGDITADRTALLTKLNLQSPASSNLLAKVSGGIGHGGGSVLPPASAGYSTLNAWVQQEASCANTAVAATPSSPAPAPAPAPSPTPPQASSACPSFAQFKTAVAPIMTKNCTACHASGGSGNGAFPMNIGTGSAACAALVGTWTTSKGEIDYTKQSQSKLILKPFGLVTHGGGLALTAAQQQVFTDFVNQEVSCHTSGQGGDTTNATVLCQKQAVAIALSPLSPTLSIGDTLALQANVSYDDGSTSTNPGGLTWTSGAPTVASVDSNGQLKALKGGTTLVKATLGPISTTLSVTVRSASATLTRVDISPAAASVAIGQQLAYQLMGTYSDGSRQAIATAVKWSVVNSTLASVTPTGLLTATVAGSTTLNAEPASCTGIQNCPATSTLTVTPSVLTSISVTPVSPIVPVGSTLQLQLSGTKSDGSTTVLSNVTWTTNDGSIIDLTSAGSITARGPGLAQVIAASGSFAVTTSVLVIADSGCSTVQQYQQTVEPILQNSCLSCHGTGLPGSPLFTLKGPNPSAYEVVANWTAAQQKVDAVSVDASKILQMAGNLSSNHPGGTILAKTTSTYNTLRSWVSAEFSCQTSNIASNLTRSSGEVLQLRLAALFPSAVGPSLPIAPDNFDMFNATGLNTQLASPDRMWSPATDVALRGRANILCKSYVDSADSKNTLFKFTASDLLSGESAPGDAATSLALATARHAWLYPYTQQAPEVQALIDLYNGVLALKGSGATVQAKQAVCVAAIMAPQFLFGNVGDADIIRRLALEVGRRPPTMADYDAYASAGNKGSFLSSYTAALQNAKTGYLTAVKSWHRTQLGLRDFIKVGGVDGSREYGNSQGASLMGATPFRGMTTTETGLSIRGIELEKYVFATQYMDLSENCTPGLAQDFDPRTTQIVWQHYNSVSGAWETIGSWQKAADGSWSQQSGSITLADHSQMTTSVDDITSVVSKIDGRNYYTSGRLVGTPVDGFIGERALSRAVNKTASQRRVRRFSPSGEQNGFSTVKLWYSGETVAICNTTSRFVATCGYRPAATANRPGAVAAATWNAGSKGTAPIGLGGLRDSYLTPIVTDHMSCGNPDTTVLANIGKPGYSEAVAWPKGTVTAAGTMDQSSLNDLVINSFDLLPAGGANSSQIIATSLSRPYAEDQAFGHLLQDIMLEPLRLTEDIVSNSRDYRMLLTAPYTIGHGELDLYYRSQNHFLPSYPAGYAAVPGGGSLRQITPTTVAPMPFAWLKSSLGTLTYGSTAYFADEVQSGTIQPRLMSGILTQMGFLGPVSVNSGKTRSLAARVFERLLCGLPSDFLSLLDTNAQQLQMKYVSTHEANGNAHLDPTKGCYGCHISLDPVASALNANFLQNPSQAATGDLKSDHIWGVNNLYGVRGSTATGTGALFGTVVTGVKDLGNVLANSTPFSQCVVKSAFKNVFGREPLGSEVGLVNSVATQFRTSLNYDYNAMIQALVASPQFQRSN